MYKLIQMFSFLLKVSFHCMKMQLLLMSKLLLLVYCRSENENNLLAGTNKCREKKLESFAMYHLYLLQNN